MGAVGVAGGDEEGQAAYDEAMNAVLTLQLECHRHTQPHRSKKDATTKWAMIEMWPMKVRTLALVCIHAVTKPLPSPLECKCFSNGPTLYRQIASLSTETFSWLGTASSLPICETSSCCI